MTIKRAAAQFLLWTAALGVAGCGIDMPFEYRYLSADVVQVAYPM